ncbi:MAG: hypothetical protein LKF88_05725 [Microbacteriaceae bacterium]|jgi:hypothetical protein|nr:hypothetical protein [Microbacteriaceae bacterium]
MDDPYEGWQSLLAAAFLRPHQGPTIFFVDDEELSHLRPGADDAARELAGAVRSRLRLADGHAMFAQIRAAYHRWRGTPRTDAPPVLPLLALTVLAATRMRSDANARSTNYYLRLAQVLAPQAPEHAVETLRGSLRQGEAFLDVVDMWQGLHAWIEAQHGVVGVSTIRDHPHYQRIGYPLSQALVRQSDRAALTRFFDALGFVPGNAPDTQVILDALDIWATSPQNRLSGTFMRALRDPDLRTLLAIVVEAHAQAWDGRVLTSDSRQRIAMRLSIDLDAWQARWLFPVPPDGPSKLTLLSPDDNHEVVLTAATGLDYYAVQDAPSIRPEHLRSGTRFRGNEYTAEFPPSPVLFLRPDLQTGAWSSAAGMIPFEEHLAIISSQHLTDFEQVAREAASPGWRLIPQRGSILLAGYAIFQGIRFTNGEVLERALSRLPGLSRIGVVPAMIPRARFVRGLPLATALSVNHYLAGGEPDLLLPTGAEPRTATVTVDGKQEHLRANGFPLELRRFISGTGPHSVTVDGQQLSFTTLEEGPDPAPPAGTGVLGWTGDTQLSGTEHGKTLAVAGARAAESADSLPVLGRRGRGECWLLHEDGHAESLPEPAPPAFLATISAQIYSPCFEINPPPSARWLAQRRRTGWHLVELGTSDAREYDLRIDVIDAWKRACDDENSAQLWKLQLTMARRSA